MCPVCIASTAVVVAGVGSTGGVLAAGIGKFTKFFRASNLALFQETKENDVATGKERDKENSKAQIAMKTTADHVGDQS